MKASGGRGSLFERLKAGLEEAISHNRGEITLKSTTLELPDPPPAAGAEELASLRREHQMSQAVFARLLNVSTKTVQSWEHGTRRPSHAALRLIQVFRRDPSGVFQAVGMNVGASGATPKDARSRKKERASSGNRSPASP